MIFSRWMCRMFGIVLSSSRKERLASHRSFREKIHENRNQVTILKGGSVESRRVSEKTLDQLDKAIKIQREVVMLGQNLNDFVNKVRR